MNRLKNIVLAICMLASVSVCAHEYTAQSVLANGNFVKIRVSESGIYRLTYEEIQSMGLNPQHVRILHMGKHPPVNPGSTMEMWKLREQAKTVAEENGMERNWTGIILLCNCRSIVRISLQPGRFVAL